MSKYAKNCLALSKEQLGDMLPDYILKKIFNLKLFCVYILNLCISVLHSHEYYCKLGYFLPQTDHFKPNKCIMCYYILIL